MINIHLLTEITCEDEPPVVDSATYVHTGNRVNDTATYSCNTIHRVTIATCRYNDKFQGIWIDIPSCEGQLKTMDAVTNLTFILAQIIMN